MLPLRFHAFMRSRDQVRAEGVEPPTSSVETKRSIQLSYARMNQSYNIGVPTCGKPNRHNTIPRIILISLLQVTRTGVEPVSSGFRDQCCYRQQPSRIELQRLESNQRYPKEEASKTPDATNSVNSAICKSHDRLGLGQPVRCCSYPNLTTPFQLVYPQKRRKGGLLGSSHLLRL